MWFLLVAIITHTGASGIIWEHDSINMGNEKWSEQCCKDAAENFEPGKRGGYAYCRFVKEH